MVGNSAGGAQAAIAVVSELRKFGTRCGSVGYDLEHMLISHVLVAEMDECRDIGK